MARKSVDPAQQKLKQELAIILKLADEARDAGKFAQAADLYSRYVKLAPERTDIHMQAAHALKEIREYDRAEEHYLVVLDREADRYDTQIQLGHFYKTSGRYRRAVYHYEKALQIDAAGAEAARELEACLNNEAYERELQQASQENHHRLTKNDYGIYIDEGLFPKTPLQLTREYSTSLEVTRLGGYTRSQWGEGHFLSGIDTIRGYVISDVPCLGIKIYIDGTLVYEGGLTSFPLEDERNHGRHRKYPFNAWIDVTGFEYGRHEVLVRIENVRGDVREGKDWRTLPVLIVPPGDERAFRESDAIIPPRPEGSDMSVEEWVNSLPSGVHTPSPNSFPIDPKIMLVQRLDQLGDMSVSVPAIRRLREIFPETKLVGLVSPANEGLARSLKVFDELITFDVPDDPVQRQRILEADGQKKLADLLRPYKFDVALDLAVSGVTHQLLYLSGAPVQLSFGNAGWRSMSFDMSTRDPRSRNDIIRHSARTLALVESLGAWRHSRAEVVRRDDLDRSGLSKFGIGKDDRFAVLHAGARIKFTQWPYFIQLAERLLRETDKRVVFFADNAEQMRILSEFDPALRDRLTVIDGKIEFDEFDALLSYCDVFVGNDSGPKHLAALRGTNVVSLHSSRIAWSEWGQEFGGVILSRKVPCAGCSLHHNHEECVRDVACIKLITVDEVYNEVIRYLGK